MFLGTDTVIQDMYILYLGFTSLTKTLGIFIYIYMFSNSCNQYLCFHICAPVCVCMYAYYASNMGWHRQLFEVWLFTVHLIVYSHNGMGFLGGKATDFRTVVFLVGVKQGVQG